MHKGKVREGKTSICINRQTKQIKHPDRSCTQSAHCPRGKATGRDHQRVCARNRYSGGGRIAGRRRTHEELISLGKKQLVRIFETLDRLPAESAAAIRRLFSQRPVLDD